MKHRLMLLAAVALIAWGGAPRVHARQPAGTQFHTAYRALIQADIARDEKRFVDAVKLYQNSAESYARLMREYPDWEPGATRFRLEHCHQELKRLKRLEKEGLIGPDGVRPTSPAPATAVPVPVSRLHSVKVSAVEFLNEGEPEAARQTLMDGMDIDPDDSAVRVLLGIAQCHAGRHHDALFLLRNVVEEEPDNAYAHVALGAAYFGLARYADAAVEMKKASDSNPSLSEPHFDLAQVLLAMDPPDAGGASYHYRKALRLGAKRDADLEERLQTASEPEEAAPASVRLAPPSERKVPQPAGPMLEDPENVVSPAGGGAEGDNAKKTWLRSIAPW